MSDTTDDDIGYAFRHRVQAQALFHLAGKSVSARTILPFQKAGTWDGDITTGTPPGVKEILSDPNHTLRMDLCEGPLVVTLENGQRGIIDVAEHLLSYDVDVRQVALRHFVRLVDKSPSWASPFLRHLFRECQVQLTDLDDAIWIGAGLQLIGAIENDFCTNVAGLRQASIIQFNEAYQQYMRRVLRPAAGSFEHDRPPVMDPVVDQTKIAAWIHKWSKLDDLSHALNSYQAACGYLPLGSENSAGALVEMWAQHHPGVPISGPLWEWSDGSPSPVGEYHVATALLDHPEWIVDDDLNRVLTSARNIIAATEDADHENSPLWRIRSILLHHYQYHLEAIAPGLNAGVVATTACWLTESVAELFGTEPEHVAKVCELLERELALSSRRWTVSRTRMSPSSLRHANLFYNSIWADSLLATASRASKALPTGDDSDEFRAFLIERLRSAMIMGCLSFSAEGRTTYAFEQVVSAHDLGIPTDGKATDVKGDAAEEDPKEATRQIMQARIAMAEHDGVKSMLQDLSEAPEGIALFYCANVQRQVFVNGGEVPCIKDFLSDREWRRNVLQKLPLTALDVLIMCLIEWQLQQEHDWQVRLPQILALECENAHESDRRQLLLAATISSSMAVDVASPIARLLTGSQRSNLTESVKEWCTLFRAVSKDSEPWIAARLRGLRGSIEGLM